MSKFEETELRSVFLKPSVIKNSFYFLKMSYPLHTNTSVKYDKKNELLMDG